MMGKGSALMDVWFTELQVPGLKIDCKVLQTLHRETSPFQEIAILDTEPFGRLLVLDDVMQTSVNDEFVYAEMMSHLPISSHPDPKDVLIIGGGDGSTAREALRYKKLNSVTQVEIDGRVVEVCRQFMPELACSYDNPRLTLHVGDGIAFVKDKEASFDVISVDAPDPVGQAAGLFSLDFYASVHRALRPDGIFVAQMESPFYNKDLIGRVAKDLGTLFPIVKFYLAFVPTYPGGLWAFALGSKTVDPALGPAATAESMANEGLRYYSPEVHRAAFVLPPFVQALLK
jgi:spermidine synthase